MIPYKKYEEANNDDKIASYVLNTNTKKFHRPSCRYVSTIKEKNREDYNGSRASIIDAGYEPCKTCDP